MTNLRKPWNLQMVRSTLGLLAVGTISSPLIMPASMAGSMPVVTISVATTTQAGYGTIKGKLIWAGAEIPKAAVEQEKGKSTKDPDVCAKDTSIYSKELVIDPKTKGIAYGVAYLVRPKGANPEKLAELLKAHPTVEVDQKNCEFLPHVTAINKGQKVIFKSSDPTGHNVSYSGFKNDAFNQTVPPNTSIERALVAETLPLGIACTIHPWMKAWVGVFDHPFFAVTKEDGSFEIQGIPPGPHRFVLWQEKIGFVTPNKGAGRPIIVKADEVLDMGAIEMGK